MPDTRALYAEYDGPVPRDLLYPPSFRIQSDMALCAAQLKSLGICYRHAMKVGDDEARARIMLRFQEYSRAWRRYRDELRQIEGA